MDEGDAHARFQYDPEFAQSGIEVSPLAMPLHERVYTFPSLRRESFHGLPGMLADSLPDRFGNALINAWLATEGRTPEDFSSVERLCYTGQRGMGALEFAPSRGPTPRTATKIEIDALVQLASEVLLNRHQLAGRFNEQGKIVALKDILRVGTSAGGARAKAVIAWNRESNEVRSGQVDAGDGFEYWLLKFDGVSGNKDKELDDPKGYGIIEYAYHLMAKAAGITMNEGRLLEENGRSHFMTRRFDRLPDGKKLHLQSLCALAHLDFNQAGAHGYEQAFLAIRRLELPMSTIEEQFRRMVFNIVARNQDDHTKNIAFLMNKEGQWSLAPAYDVTYSHNPVGAWTTTHQMTVNGKRDNFTVEDLKECAKTAGLKRGRAQTILTEVTETVSQWPNFADQAGLPRKETKATQQAFRLTLPNS